MPEKPMKDIKQPETLEQLKFRDKKRRAKAMRGGPNKLAPSGPDKLCREQEGTK